MRKKKKKTAVQTTEIYVRFDRNRGGAQRIASIVVRSAGGGRGRNLADDGHTEQVGRWGDGRGEALLWEVRTRYVALMHWPTAAVR